LEKGEAIKPKTLESLSSFTAVFDRMNITNNRELAGYVSQARDMFKNVDAGALKEDEVSNKIQSGLDKMVTSFKTEADAKLLRDIEF